MKKSAMLSVLAFGLPVLSLLAMPSYAVPPGSESSNMGAPLPGTGAPIPGNGVPEASPTTAPVKPKPAAAKRSTFPVLHPVSKKDLEWGTEQLEQLLEDRPQMQAYVEEGDAIWTKAVRGFAGETTGVRIGWTQEGWDKPGGYISDHLIPTEKDPNHCYIRLAKLDEKGLPVDGEKLWSGLMYEFNNLANYKAFDAINKLAIEGRFTKKEWMNQVCYAEWRAFKPTLEFYHGTFAPLMFKRNIKTRPVIWRIVEWRDTYPAWIGQFRNPHSYPYTFWGAWWDTQMYPYLRDAGKLKEAQIARAKAAQAAAQQSTKQTGKQGKPGAKPVNAGKPTGPANKQPATKSGSAQRSHTSAWDQRLKQGT